ncbi:MAG TPA: prephenate dehydratase domain-containing protein [Pyrinomonadaceae bacterium]|nr:prephenate dehydratase domain-containing protein [Pyrinomonadaceae bacterium]
MSVVAIQGIRGSYSEEAARRLMGADAEIVECLDFAQAFDTVANARAEYAVVPVENKIVGEIEDVTGLLRMSSFSVIKQSRLKVEHVLTGTPDCDGDLESIRTVRSHIEALKQCRRFLTVNTHIEQVAGADTASSVRRVVEDNIVDNAAIGSRRAAEMYGAKVIAENVADDKDNWTTFCLIGR